MVLALPTERLNVTRVRTTFWGNKIPGPFQDPNAAFPEHRIIIIIINNSNKHANICSTMHSTSIRKQLLLGLVKICLLYCSWSKRNNMTKENFRSKLDFFYVYIYTALFWVESDQWIVHINGFFKNSETSRSCTTKPIFFQTFPALKRQSLLFQEFSDFQDPIQTLSCLTG